MPAPKNPEWQGSTLMLKLQALRAIARIGTRRPLRLDIVPAGAAATALQGIGLPLEARNHRPANAGQRGRGKERHRSFFVLSSEIFTLTFKKGRVEASEREPFDSLCSFPPEAGTAGRVPSTGSG